MLRIWHTSISPIHCKTGVVVPICEEKNDTRYRNNCREVTHLSVPCEVSAHISLDSIREKLVTRQRHGQCRFTPKKSSKHRILVLRVLTECLRDFRTEVFAAYVDRRKAVDSVKRDVLRSVNRVVEYSGVGSFGIVNGLKFKRCQMW